MRSGCFPTSGARRRAAWQGQLASVLMALLLAGPAWGKEMPGARALLEQHISELDKQIAQRMLVRPQTPSAKMPRLDMEIDLRITARWFFAQAAAQKEASEMQVVGRLRGQLALEATAGVEEVLNRQREKLTLGQVEGMSRLHELTFKLADAKGAGSLDEVSRQLAGAALMIAGGSDALPLMRPRAAERDAPPAQRNGTTNVTAVANRIAGLNVSVPLRQQLTLLASAASSEKDGAVAKTLGMAFDLAAALQNNVAVMPENRVQLEGQLAEGIALYLDRRTREAGTVRLAELREYHRIVERIERLRLSPEASAKYAPLFSWAQREAEGKRALAALERFVNSGRRFEQRKSLPPTGIQNLRHSMEELEKRHATASEGFSKAFDELIKTTGSTGAAGLEAHAGEMAEAVDMLEKLDEVAATLDTLGALKPKPFGGLERRIVLAAVAISTNTPEKGASVKLLDDLHGLARLTSELSLIPVASLSGNVDGKYAGGRLSALELKWKSLAADVASTVAAGGEVDAEKLSRLAMARQVYESLFEASAVEGAIAASSTLERWIDWRMSGADLSMLFQPYQEAMAAAVGGYLSDAPKPLEEWTKIEKRYRPLVNLVTQAQRHRAQVQGLPEGLAGAAAGLLTPCANAPFATERYVSFATAICRSRLAAGDEPGASEVLELLLNRLQR